MVYLYRYKLHLGCTGGVVSARNSAEALIKLQEHYGVAEDIEVWFDDTVSTDIIEVYSGNGEIND